MKKRIGILQKAKKTVREKTYIFTDRFFLEQMLHIL